jgi:LysR family glycine cleavage system transcriptional activator
MGGQGVAMGSPIFFQREIAGGLLVQPFDIVAENTSGHYVVYPEERRRSPKITLFRDWLLAEAEADPMVQKMIALAKA